MVLFVTDVELMIRMSTRCVKANKLSACITHSRNNQAEWTVRALWTGKSNGRALKRLAHQLT